ncbi:hypothetical protein [uncultured Ruegeria sp.]|uniref:putative quinol monooxygenase n=1 Tax=uncultured Ruegeria sp. TaxID=259304 RepID=UPI002638AB85|nr:hypothetical protein [uncultured Ruegeria sp.]
MTVKVEAFDALSVFLRENLPNVRGFAGAFLVNLFYDPETRTVLLQEEWASKEHHMAYLSFIQDAGAMDALLGFVEGAPEVTYYERLVM